MQKDLLIRFISNPDPQSKAVRRHPYYYNNLIIRIAGIGNIKNMVIK